MLAWLRRSELMRSRPHRYVFLLYRQDTPVAKVVEGRKNWGVEQFVREHGLELVGANFFYAENKGDV